MRARADKGEQYGKKTSRLILFLSLFICEKEDNSLHVESSRPSTHFDSLITEYIFLGICLRCLGLKVKQARLYKNICHFR